MNARTALKTFALAAMTIGAVLSAGCAVNAGPGGTEPADTTTQDLSGGGTTGAVCMASSFTYDEFETIVKDLGCSSPKKRWTDGNYVGKESHCPTGTYAYGRCPADGVGAYEWMDAPNAARCYANEDPYYAVYQTFGDSCVSGPRLFWDPMGCGSNCN